MKNRQVIYNLLKYVNNYNTKKRAVDDPLRLLFVKNVSLCAASNSCFTLREISRKAEVKTNPRNIHRTIQTCEYIIRRKLKWKSTLTAGHEQD